MRDQDREIEHANGPLSGKPDRADLRVIGEVADEKQYRYCECCHHQAPVAFDLETEDGPVAHDEQNRARGVQDGVESWESAKNG